LRWYFSGQSSTAIIICSHSCFIRCLWFCGYLMCTLRPLGACNLLGAYSDT